MFGIPADYLGGDPDSVRYIDSEGVLTVDEGVMRFDMEYFPPGKATSALMASTKGEHLTPIVIQPDELVSIGAGDANQMRTLTRAVVGSMIGGEMGGLIGAATSQRNSRLAIVAKREHGLITAVFAVDDSSARRFIDVVNRWRRDVGLAAADMEEMAASATAPDAGSAGDGVLVEIRDLLAEMRDLLRAGRG